MGNTPMDHPGVDHAHSAHSHAAHPHNTATASKHDHSALSTPDHSSNAAADDHAAGDSTATTAHGESGAGHHHDLGKVGKMKCSVCASCCTAAALPSQAITFVGMAPATGVVPSAPQAVIAFLTSGPERPPRLSLA